MLYAQQRKYIKVHTVHLDTAVIEWVSDAAMSKTNILYFWNTKGWRMNGVDYSKCENSQFVKKKLSREDVSCTLQPNHPFFCVFVTFNMFIKLFIPSFFLLKVAMTSTLVLPGLKLLYL